MKLFYNTIKTSLRHRYNIGASNWFLSYCIIFACLAWIAALFFIPTFDLDEALYRQSAAEMKLSHHFLFATWNFEPYFEKPATYIWFIALVSRLVDGPGSFVSLFSVRLPSLLATWFVLLCIGFTWKKCSSSADKANVIVSSWPLPVLAFLLALIPAFGAGAAIIDPLLTCSFTPFLCYFVYRYKNADGAKALDSLSPSICLFLGSTLGFAMMLKGLIGIILPLFSILLHETISFIAMNSVLRARGSLVFRYIRHMWGVAKNVWLLFFVAIFVGTFFYATIYFNGGEKFVYHFFINEQLHRGVRSFEGHSGPVYYYLIVFLLGGSLLSSFIVYGLIKLSSKIKDTYRAQLFSLSWILTFLIFFSLVATKLPNYIWPVWPAAALLFSSLYSNIWFQIKNQKKSYLIPALLSFVPLLFGAFFLLFPFIIYKVIPVLPLDYRVFLVLKSISPIPVSIFIAMSFVGLLFLCQAGFIFRLFISRSAAKLYRVLVFCGCANSVIFLSLCFFVMPFVQKIYWSPLSNLTKKAEALVQKSGGIFATQGLNSPTVSSAYSMGAVEQHYKNDDSGYSNAAYVLVPVWLEEKCSKYGFQIIAQESYLRLCKKSNVKSSR